VVRSRIAISREPKERGSTYVESVWVLVVLAVVMHGPCIQNHGGVFRDKVAVVREVFGCDVRYRARRSCGSARPLRFKSAALISMVEAGL